MDHETKFALSGGFLLLLVSTLLILGTLIGCAETTKPSDPAWDKNCQRNYSERQRDFDACKKKVENLIPSGD